MSTTPTTYDDLAKEWSDDISKITSSDYLIIERDLSSLHKKYSDWMGRYTYEAKKAQSTYKKMRLLRLRYYKGDLNADGDLLTKLGWQPLQKKVDSSLVKDYLDGDVILNNLNLEFEDLANKAEFCQRSVQHISNKGYALQSAIKFKMFLHDGSQ
jgi:hypothetical protein